MPKVLLREIYAKSLGLIDEAHLEVGPGFTVITGETGTGKTLLLGALQLSLGLESAAARLGLRENTRAVSIFESDGHEIALRREVGTSGRLRSLLNGEPSSTDALRNLADSLIAIHGQHDSLSLKSRGEILRHIDRHGDIDAEPLRLIRERLRDLRARQSMSGGDASLRLREIEFVGFQIQEIDDAKLTDENELDRIIAELTRITALRDGQIQLMAVLRNLDDDTNNGLLDDFARTIERLPNDSTYDEARRMFDSALELAREATHELVSLSDPEAYDPSVFAELESRVGQLQSLVRKYGGSLPAVFAAWNNLVERRAKLMDDSRSAEEIDSEIEELERREEQCANDLLRRREESARHLSEAVSSQLSRVALANASLEYRVAGVDGSRAQIFFSANSGTRPGPLGALASGGELSRVLLALSLETSSDEVVAVFDEIDAGLGGQTAQQIGECLHELSQRQQVLAVTHLASVAARADTHFVVEKTDAQGQSSASIRLVTGDERVSEIARMLSGTESSESRALAVRLLGGADIRD